MTEITSVDDTQALLVRGNYVADRALATSLYLALKLGRPLFLEGEAGVGKTEIGKVLAETLHRRLVRLQCYEGLDVSSAVYEWNYARQMLEIRMAEAEGVSDREALAKDIFTEAFLIHRPLLQALEPQEGAGPPVLLIDELDRTDEPFEAYLLEVLADFQITIPEIGTIKAEQTADRDHHLEPDPRDPRRAEAPLLLPLGRLSRPPSASCRSSASACRARPSGSRSRSWASSSACARRTCSSSRASPKRWTGPRR